MKERKMTDIILFVILIVLSSCCSAAEISFSSVSEAKLKRRADDKPSSLMARCAVHVKDNFSAALSSILVGNNLANIAASAVSTVIVVMFFGEDKAYIATIATTVLVLIFGEVFPKIIGKDRDFELAQLLAVPVRLMMIVFYPITKPTAALIEALNRRWQKIIQVDDKFTEDDLETLIDAVENETVIDGEQADLLQSALDFDDECAYENITPRVDLVMIDIENEKVNEINDKILSARYTRIPVYEDSPDNIIGILHTTHLMKYMAQGHKITKKAIRKMLMPPVFVHHSMHISDVYKKMREEKTHMVIVCDEFGGTSGVLTMEDVLENLVGEIWDEFDVVEKECVEKDKDTWIVDGDMPVTDLMNELDEDDDDIDAVSVTVGGLAIEKLNDFAEAGESFTWNGYRFTVLELEGRRVASVKIEKLPAEEAQS